MDFSVVRNRIVVHLTGRVDTSNAGEFERQIEDIVAANERMPLVLDAGALDYISSAGLRVVIRLLKRLKDVSISDANREVYDVFEMTGITQLMHVGRSAREVSIDGCELIGEGGFAKVYRIDPETIVKVYNPACTREFVEAEREQARDTFVMGVPTAIPFDLVRVGDCWGLAFELLDADTVARIVDRDPSRVDECARILGELLKELHTIEVPQGKLRDRAQVIRSWCTDTIGPYLKDAEVEALCAYLDSIPHRTTFLHGDYHTKNVMLRDGEPLLIDVGDAAFGNPIFDWAAMGLCYVSLPQAIRAGRQPASLLGYDLELVEPLWRGQMAHYLGTDDAAALDAFQNKIMPLTLLASSFVGANLRGNDPEDLKVRADLSMRALVLPAIANAPAIS